MKLLSSSNASSNNFKFFVTKQSTVLIEIRFVCQLMVAVVVVNVTKLR